MGILQVAKYVSFNYVSRNRVNDPLDTLGLNIYPLNT